MTTDMITKHLHLPMVVRASGRRELEGILTAQIEDRVGDVVVTDGANTENFRNLSIHRRGGPLLLHHDTARPIGTWMDLRRVVWEGVPALLGVGKLVPAGESRDADEAWTLIQAGGLGGISIGFRPLDPPTPRPGAGVQYDVWELLEASLVTVPCCPAAVLHNAQEKRWRV